MLPRPRQTFRVGASDYAMMTVVPALVRALRREAPGAVLNIMPMGETSLPDLASGHLDSHSGGPVRRRRPSWSRELFRERFIGLVCERHPLAIRAGQGKLDLDDYLAHPHVIVSFRDPRQSPIDALTQLGRTRGIGLSTPSFVSNVAALNGTDLILSLPSRLAALASGLGLVELRAPARRTRLCLFPSLAFQDGRRPSAPLATGNHKNPPNRPAG